MSLEPRYSSTQLEDPPIELGALDRSGLLSLATLDDDAAAPCTSASPPPAGHDSSAVMSPAPGQSARVSDAPVDLFAPPGASLDDVLVELADDELEWTRKRMNTPPGSPPDPGLKPALPTTSGMQASQSPDAPPGLFSAQATSALPRSSPVLPVSPVPPASPVLALTQYRQPRETPGIRLSTRARLVASPRARLIAGVVLAIVLGFVPAHIVASLREDRAFRPIDARVSAVQVAVDSQASYDALDGFRAGQLDGKRSARNTIALTSLLIWAAAGGAIAYVWFRRTPWGRLRS